MKKNIGFIIGVAIILVGFILFLVGGPETADENQELWNTNWELTNSARDRVFNNSNLNNINQQTFYANVLTAERLETINENLQQLNDNLRVAYQNASNTDDSITYLRSTLFALTLMISGTIVATASIFGHQPQAVKAFEQVDVEVE